MRIATRSFIAILASILCWPFVASAQQQPTVLAEIFGNVDCLNCRPADSTYNLYMQSNPGVVALINYHNNFPDASDTFYIASIPGGANTRNNFYAAGSGDPVAFIDGYFAGAGQQNEKQWETYSSQSIGKTITINPRVGHGPNGIDTIDFSVTGTTGTLVTAYVAIKESNLYYVNHGLYGPTPGNLWNDVFRAMLTPANGINFSLSGTHTFSVVYDSSHRPYVSNFQNVTAVVFLQDVSTTGTNNSHQVEALGEVSLAPASSVTASNVPTSQLIIPENPLQANDKFQVELAAPGNVQVTVFDMLGRKIRTLVEGMLPAGETAVDMNGTTLPSGAYIARMMVGGLTVDQKKFIVP